jgi:prolyl 4-hydroxylase
VDSVLAAQRPEMRAMLSPHYDLPLPFARAHGRCYLPGWSGHNHYKLMLPTECAAPRTMPWHRRSTPRSRLEGRSEDALTCPLDTTVTTPRVPRRVRNVTIPPHTPHQVSVVQVLASPRIRLLRNFLTAEEAAEILRLATPLFHRSPVRSVAQDRRTSSTATLAGGMLGGGGSAFGLNWAVKSIRERISAFSGYADHMLEPLQVVRYHPGEKYEPHHDLFDLCDFPQKPRRHLTFLIYLNDLPEGAGGETTFPRLHLSVKPEKHMALVFNDVLDNGMDDERTEHSGTPPTSGVKYAINCWIRARAMPARTFFG